MKGKMDLQSGQSQYSVHFEKVKGILNMRTRTGMHSALAGDAVVHGDAAEKAVFTVSGR